jgi:hypothetical protein
VISRSQPLPAVYLWGYRHILAECASCERIRPLRARGLCNSCYVTRFHNGTLSDYGYVKADRMTDYARLRLNGATQADAARRIGVSRRTGERYEAELAGSGRAPWREWSCAA